MTVGLPGTGIGGLFYLLSALWMPFHESIRMLRGRSRSGDAWVVISTQTAIALAICFAIWFTGWSLAAALRFVNTHAAQAGFVGAYLARGTERRGIMRNLIGPLPFLIAAATLLMNLAIVHIVRFLLWIGSSRQAVISAAPAREPVFGRINEARPDYMFDDPQKYGIDWAELP